MKIEDPESISKSPDGKAPHDQPAWREQFPIDWPRDDFRSRRDFTKLLGLTSLAFVVGQLWIVALSLRRRTRTRSVEREIAAVGELPVGGSKLFEYPEPGKVCVLVRLPDGGFAAFSQKCTHLSCPVMPEPAKGRFHCACHNGSFDLATGEPLAGPPRRPLPRLRLEVRGERVFAVGVEDGVL